MIENDYFHVTLFPSIDRFISDTPPFVSFFSGSNAGVPLKLLFEAEGMKVTVEMKNGEIYRGLLINAEDTMNMTISDVVRTARTGQVSKLPTVYIRGSGIRFISLPELLKSAPVFKKVVNLKKKVEAETSAGTKRKRE